MTADDPDYPYCLIDGPGPFAPIGELLPWRRECMAMLVEYPDHPQWQSELESVEKAIAWQFENPQLKIPSPLP